MSDPAVGSRPVAARPVVSPGDKHLAIFGVALLAGCTLAGALLGEGLGQLLHVKANVGGVGIAMILLIAARMWLARHGFLTPGVRFGVEFWGALYIPIVVAMAAQQNVVAAARGGPLVIVAGLGAVASCFLAVALLDRIGGHRETMDEIEARMAREAQADTPAPGHVA